jgi:hypothetical protein
MKARYLTLLLALYALTGCATSNDPTPPPTPSVAASQASDDEQLTPLQQHIKEDALKELNEQDISKQGIIDYLSKEYPVEDVKAGVAAMACESDWQAEARDRAKALGVEDKTTLKSTLLDEGFTEEEAEYGTNPVAD